MYEDIEEFINTCGLFQCHEYPNNYQQGQGIPTNFLFQKEPGREHLDRARFQRDGLYILPFDRSPKRVTTLLQDILVVDKDGNEFTFIKGNLTLDYDVNKAMLKLQRGISSEVLVENGRCDSPNTEEEGYLPIPMIKSACD